MPRSLRILMLGVCVVATASTALRAQTPVTITGELAFRSSYLFAGIPFAAGEVQQAKVTGAAGAFTANVFSVYDFDAGEVTEADLYADYYSQVAPTVGLFVGAALYNFRIGGQWEATTELYGGVTLAAPLSPTLYVAHDFDLSEGTNAMLSVSHGVPLGTSGVTLDLGAEVAYNAEYYTMDSGFSFLGLGAAVAYLRGIGMAEIEAREQALLAMAQERLSAIKGLRIVGTAPGKAAVISFLVDGAHAHDLATLLDLEGVAVRSGHHCAHPLMAHLGVPATCRASLAFYNTHVEIERLGEAIEKARTLLA